eukprot:scaffold1318_cov388-Prasinococcus_capsulatus_cf.AAC.45
MPRLVASLFIKIASDIRHTYNVTMSMCQVYNEHVDDMLNHTHQNLKLYNDGSNTWHVQGLTWHACNSPDSLLKALDRGRRHLVYAETQMNKASSRSHCIIRLRVTTRTRMRDKTMDEPQDSNLNSEDDPEVTQDVSGGLTSPSDTIKVQQTSAILTVVDLAGSERIKRTKAEGLRLQEATNINKSMLTLGNVVHALAKKDSHVPFRDSSLTKLLEGSIGGNCRTSMLVCVNPHISCWGESIGALEFATRAMRIESRPLVNMEEVTLTRAQLLAELETSFRDEVISQSTDQILDLESRLKYTKQLLESEKTESQGRLDRMEAAEMAAKQSNSEAERLRFRIRQLSSQLEETTEELNTAKEELDRVLAEAEELQQQQNLLVNSLEEEKMLHAQTKLQLSSQREALSASAATFGDQAQRYATSHHRAGRAEVALLMCGLAPGRLIEATQKCSELETSKARAEEHCKALCQQLEMTQDDLQTSSNERSSLLGVKAELQEEKTAAQDMVKTLEEKLKASEKTQFDNEVEYEESRLKLIHIVKQLMDEQNELESEVRESAETATEELNSTRTLVSGLQEQAREAKSKDAIIHDLLEQLVAMRTEKSHLQRAHKEEGTNGKSYRRLVRMDAQGTLQWATVGEFKHKVHMAKQVSSTAATSKDLAKEDKCYLAEGGLVVRMVCKERDVSLKMTSRDEAKAWHSAVTLNQWEERVGSASATGVNGMDGVQGTTTGAEPS